MECIYTTPSKKEHTGHDEKKDKGKKKEEAKTRSPQKSKDKKKYCEICGRYGGHSTGEHLTPEQLTKKRETRSDTRPYQRDWKKPDSRKPPTDSRGEGTSKPKFEKKNLKVKTLVMSADESSDSSESERELTAAILEGASSGDDEPLDDPKPRNIGKRGGTSKMGFRTRSL